MQLNILAKMQVKSINFLILAKTLVALFTVMTFFTMGCADDPSSLGLNFIPPGETTGVRTFDSYIDTMQITSVNVRKYVNTSTSPNLMVGLNGTYNAEGLLRFGGLSNNYDSATVNSATLTLSYRNYYFPVSAADSLGQIAFDVYKINRNLNFSTITLDSVNNSTFGTVSQGSYTGSPAADSLLISINLNTSLVKDWLEYAADTSYPNKNYGIVLSPSAASAVIKAFYSGLSSISENIRPKLTIIVTKNNDTDTLTTSSSATISLVNASIMPNPETFSLQAGVSYVQKMSFDLSKIPSTATINDVQLYLTLDSANSKFSAQTSFSIAAQYISDTTGLVTDGFSFTGSPAANGQYLIRVISNFQASPFQRWLLGAANNGIMIRASNQLTNLDLFSFYNITVSDPGKKPRVVIKYTPRTTP
jgi:hypothetical protein